MSKTLHLVPNLNKMMESYTKIEEEAAQATQAKIGQEEERVEVRVESEQSVEETKKRKREAIEAETEQRNERVRTFISDKASILLKESLKSRGLIFKRGFNKSISPFTEMLE